jgi:hypothetical protein
LRPSLFRVRACLLFFLCAAAATSQTTQGLISGQLVDSVTGQPIAEASVIFDSATTNLMGAASSDASGYYYLPLLSPGIYQIRVTAKAYQSQEVQELQLTVAARIELDFRLRPLSDVWESGQYRSVFLPGQKTIVPFYGPDVDTTKSGSFEAQKGTIQPLESSVSEVIDFDEINNLPLEGRDVYSLLVTQPGVTSDSATGRGLGLSVNGQRPSSSNYLLDGLENDNYLITGPLATVAPEAVQEYRISTNNFSAEYGRTSGFLANAITRTGGEQFHGVVYFYLENEVLNANAFQQNLIGAPRSIDKQDQPGFFVGGPVLKNRLFFSSAYEYFRSRGTGDPYPFDLPTPAFLQYARLIAPNSPALQLLTQYPSPITNTANPAFTQVETFAPPVAVNRILAIERLDYNSPDGKERLMGRVLINRLTEPDFIWSPYKAFISPLHENTVAAGGSYIHAFRANLTNEAKLSYSTDGLGWNRPHPEIPTLDTADGVTLPGSLAFYAYKNANNSWEALDNLIWTHGRHLVTVGGGLLWRSSNGYLTAGQDGQYMFPNVASFALGDASFFEAAVDRTALPSIQQPNPNRAYNYGQDFLFAEDTYKLTPRLTVNYGVRYEFYGGAENTGSAPGMKDALVQLGSGSSLAQQLVGATLDSPASSGDEQIFRSSNDFEVRSGAAYDLFGTGRTLLRGGFGTFYDRPFDNLWENVRENNLILPVVQLTGPTNFLAPISTVLQTLQGQTLASSFPDLTLVDPNLRNGRVKSYFAGVQQRITNNLILEVNGLGSYGRSLITNDVINRSFSTLAGRYNNNLPDIAYRANEGFSDYNALTAVLRYRTSRGMVQGSYTWSHSIDNQSDPLVGDFFNLTFTSIQTAASTQKRSTFSEQFNPNSDRGNSDFDQRHNLVVFSYWNLPAPFAQSKAGLPLRNWTVAGLAAFRSGLPYTVYGPTSGAILNNRADLINPTQAVFSNPAPVPGGAQLLDPAAFAPAPAGTLGNSGRNAFIGPGFYSLDLSLARAFPLPWLGEAGQLRVRADAYNVLNHANLGNPDAQLGDPDFGVATFGRQGYPSGFPAVAPLNETPREIQLSVRVVF